MRVVPISAEPAITERQRPPLGTEIEAEIAQIHAELLAEPGGYDDEIWLVSDWNGEAISVWRGRYSHYLLHRRLGEQAPPGLYSGNLGTIVMACDQNGRWLWQRRAETLADGGGRWVQAVTGAVKPGESLLRSALRESEEEIGLGATDYELFEPLALVGTGDEGVSIVYLARMCPGARPRTSAEVSALALASDPASLGPLYGCLAEMHERLLNLVAASRG